MQVEDWPLVLAGPIVRRVEPRLACVWAALRSAGTVRLEIWDGVERADTTRAPLVQASTHTLRAADNLHIGLPVVEIPSSRPPFQPARIYSYNLTITEDATSASRTLSSLGLLQDVAGVEQDGKLTTRPHLALGYANGALPSFVLPPPNLTDLKLLHGSCRRPHANTPDAMAFIDDLIGDTRADGLRRPHQLFLTGDQIYADDVATTLLEMLIPVANDLTGSFVIGDKAIGSVERLPTRFPATTGDSGGKSWPADYDHFPAGLRKNVALKDARTTTNDGESHLLSFGEFCAMHLFCWCNALWPEQLPRMEDVFRVPVDLEGLDIWKLHTGLNDLTGTRLAQFMAANCLEVRESFESHRRTIKKFRDGLPKVRRALANVATYMIFDDHEVTDDWYLSPVWRDRVLTAPLGRALVRNGLLAYALCQAWGNDPKRFQADVRNASGQLEPGPHKQLLANIPQLFPHGEPAPPVAAAASAIDKLLGLDGQDPPVTWHYSVSGPRHLVQVLDCRTRRSYATRVSGPGNVSAKALLEQLPGGPLPAGIDLLVLVSSLTVLGTPVIDELIGPMLFRIFDLFGHGNQSEMPGLDPDAIEAWPYDPNAFEALLKRLEPYRRVVILSGDVHFATSAAMSYWKKGDTLPARFAQFISSALQNLIRSEVRMASQYMTFMQNVIQAKIGIERLGWNTSASDLVQVPAGALPAAALRDRLRKTPVLLPSEGWPAGTVENPLKPPDWTWRMDIFRDDRPDTQRASVVRPVDLVPGSPTTDVATNLDGYRKAMVRHVKQMDKERDHLTHARQILFASNLGQVTFVRGADQILRGVHELYALAAHDPAATLPAVVTRHEIPLDVLSTSPPEQRTRPTFRAPHA